MIHLRRYSLFMAALLGLLIVSINSANAADNSASAADKGPVVICAIDDTTGNLARVASRKVYGYRLAVDEINKEGGIFGKPVKLIEYNGQSQVEKYQELARRCILRDHANVLMAGYTGAERAAARAVAEHNHTIMWHNNQDEGGIASHYFFHSGPTPEQQMLATLPYMIKKFGPRIAFIGADYNYCRTIGEWLHVAAGMNGGKIVMEEYFPFSQNSWTSTINQIQRVAPDFQVHCLVGSDQEQFYPQAAASGLHIPMWSNVTVEDGYEQKLFPPGDLTNLYTPPAYAQAVQTKASKDFIARLHKRFPNMGYVSEHTVLAYIAVKAMAVAWKRAGTDATEATIDALQKGVVLKDTPLGLWKLYGSQHYAGMGTYLFRVDKNNHLDLIEHIKFTPASFIKQLGVNLIKEPKNYNKKFTPKDMPQWKKYFSNSH